MTVSREDAVQVLSKWKSESTPVPGIFGRDGSKLTFTGVIHELSDDGVVVVNFPTPEMRVCECAIGFDRVAEFDYADLREAPPEIQKMHKDRIIAQLRFLLPNDSICCLFEVGPPESR